MDKIPDGDHMERSVEFFLPLNDEEVPSFCCKVTCIGQISHDWEEANIARCYQYRSDYQIIFIRRGCGKLQIGDDWYSFANNSLILYKPAEVQRYEIRSNQGKDLWWLYFEKMPEEILLKTFHFPEGTLYHVRDPETLLPVFEAILTEAGNTADPFLLSMLTGTLLTLISRSVTPAIMKKNNASPDTEIRVRMVIDEIQSDYTRNVQIKEYASRASLNKGYFIEVFKQLTGLTPLAYRTKLRMEKAKDLLTNTKMSIQEISKTIGYMDSMYFSKHFKQFTGVSPGKYRDSITLSPLT